MSTPADPLQEQINLLRQSLAHIQVVQAAQRAQITSAAGRLDAAGVDDLRDQFTRLAQTVADALDAAAPNGPVVPSWAAMDAEARGRELALTREWVDRVLRPWYLGGGGYQLVDCWAQHPPAVVELSLAATFYRYIYGPPRPGPIQRAAEWHDRWLPGCMRRVAATTSACTLGQHVAGLQCLHAVAGAASRDRGGGCAGPRGSARRPGGGHPDHAPERHPRGPRRRSGHGPDRAGGPYPPRGERLRRGQDREGDRPVDRRVRPAGGHRTMTCTDYERHERLLECRHPLAGVQVHVQLADGCSGNVCQDCFAGLDIRRWPDLTDRIAGPAAGLDTLQMLRALSKKYGSGGP